MKRLFLAICVVSLWPAAVIADDRDEIATLRAEMRALTERLAVLESRAAAGDSVGAATRREPAEPERLKIKADVRYRHEVIDEDNTVSRQRERIRARVGVTASVSENADLAIQLVSGSDDPVSGNQSLGDAGSTKSIGIDLANFTLRPAKGHKLIAGKMKNPLVRPGGSALVWDSDYNPEGLAWSYGSDNFFARLTGQWIEERKAKADSIMFGAQAGTIVELAGGSKLTLGAGYYDFGATRGRAAFFDGDSRGNTLDANGNYLFGYEIVELFAEWRTRLGEMPFSAYADWVNNGGGATDDTGTEFGARLGKASDPGTWEFGYSFTDLEADAVVGTFTDSDIGGGGTAISGHRLGLSYAFDRKIRGKITYFISKNAVDTMFERDYNRLQADISLSY